MNMKRLRSFRTSHHFLLFLSGGEDEMEAPLWERSKENAAPLQRGRNVQTLEASLAMDGEQKAENERMVEHYERLVRPIEASDCTPFDPADDPLIHWLSYIKFHQGSFPSDKHAQFLLFERCLRSLSRVPRYQNDVRFIRVCCMYAEQTDQPSSIFQHLHSQKIGVDTALFWMAWGFVAEHMQDFKLAEQIYSKGIRKKAQPVEKLVVRHRQFQRRMTRHWLNSTTGSNEDVLRDEDEDIGVSNRGALGALSEDAVRRNHRSRASNREASTFTIRQDPGAQALNDNNNNNSNKSGGFAIFSDSGAENNNGLDDSFAPVAEPRRLERQQDRRKENTQRPEVWNDRGGYSSRYASAAPAPARPSPAFSVYVDEQCAEKLDQESENRERAFSRHTSARDDRKFKDRKEGIADRLGQDPLRYVRDPSRLACDEAAARPAAPARRERKPGIMAVNKRLLKNTEGKEQSFEEARLGCKYYTLAVIQNVNLLSTNEAASSMSMEESMDDVTMEDLQRPDFDPTIDTESSRQVSMISTSNGIITPRNASTASSTVDENLAVGAPADPTINTQLAFKEVSMMFSSPAVGQHDSESVGNFNLSRLGQSLDESGDTADLGAIKDILGGDAENDGPRNPGARSEDDPDFDRFVLRELREQGTESAGIACAADQRNIGRIAQHNPLRGTEEKALETNPGFNIYEDNVVDNEALAVDQKGASSSFSEPPIPSSKFSIFQETSPDHADSEGDTATLSLLGDVMDTLCSDDDQKTSQSSGQQLKRKRQSSVDSLTTPSVMRIDISRQDATAVVVASGSMPGKYRYIHTQDTQNAWDLLKKRGKARRIRANTLSLAKVLEQKRVYHLPDLVVPKTLKGKKSTTGTGINVGESAGVVQHELGRGAYGVVALLETVDDADMIAVKAQSPIECLAWEYRVLELLAERLEGHCPTFVPRPLSFVALADGALLSMTAGSKSGLNLVDLLNFYNITLGESVPEILVLYYTSRMLHHLEMLHWFGKILHCDAKPDNWVLVSSACVAGDEVDGADLMLVDFGRAKDMASVTSVRQPLDATFVGEASAKEMMCVAMRNGLPWSFDVDTFGVCAAVHVLLFGCHMEIVQNLDQRWMPKEELKRYHQRELWLDVFNTFLNVEYGSRPMSLRQIRRRIEAHLSSKAQSDDLVSALKRQAALLPITRVL